jgi:hypothetical protein
LLGWRSIDGFFEWIITTNGTLPENLDGVYYEFCAETGQSLDQKAMKEFIEAVRRKNRNTYGILRRFNIKLINS